MMPARTEMPPKRPTSRRRPMVSVEPPEAAEGVEEAAMIFL